MKRIIISNRHLFSKKQYPYFSFIQTKTPINHFTILNQNFTSKNIKQLIPIQKRLFTRKRTNQNYNDNSQEQSNTENEYIIDIESNSYDYNDTNNNNNSIHINRFTNNKLDLLIQTKPSLYKYYLSIIGYIFVALFLLRVMRKTYKNKEQARWKKYLKYLISLGILIYISFQLGYYYHLSKITIKRISLLSDGKQLEVDFFYPRKTDNFYISSFKKIPKQDLIHLPHEFITLAMGEDSYLTSYEDDVYLIPADSVILEKDIFSQVASSQSINIKN